MPRDLPIGNGTLLLNFDHNYQLRDFYFPHVGKENQTNGGPGHFGVWVAGEFSWVSDDAWTRKLTYQDDTLVTDVKLENAALLVRLNCNDTVDFNENVWVRRIEVTNLAQAQRELRFFFHHDFEISESGIGNTAYYEPSRRAVLHYKGKRWFLINGSRAGGDFGVDQWATGLTKIQGKEGTWRDAEDGTLGGNPIAQGSVDSTIALHITLEAGAIGTLYYWVACGETFEDVTRINRLVRDREPHTLIDRTAAYWRLWVNKNEYDFGMLPDALVREYKQSLLILRTQIDRDGGILAANDSDITSLVRDTYSYVWPRDGALVAHALDLADQLGLAQRFFDFAGRVITKEGYFLHKYNPDGSIASSWHPWLFANMKELPIQEDETGLVLWALWQHFEKFRDVEFVKPYYRAIVTRAADWMMSYLDVETQLPLPGWDLWEERRGVHAYTLGATWAGMMAAASFADAFGEDARAWNYRRVAKNIKTATEKYLWQDSTGRFARMINRRSDGGFDADLTVDAALCGLWAFGMFDPDDPKIVPTMQAIADRLWIKTPVGGVARYENDYYHQISQDVANVPGNPWFICTLWLAQWHIACAKSMDDLKPALEYLSWVANHALASGVLAEQAHPYDNSPLSVSPLTWSHAAYVTTLLEYLDKLSELDLCATCHNPRHYRESIRLREQHRHHELNVTEPRDQVG